MKYKCVCKYCGKVFYKTEYYIKNGFGKYCSKSCKQKHQVGKHSSNWRGGKAECKCKICNKIFYVSNGEKNRGGGKYCSHNCFNISQRGSGSSRWIDGSTKISKIYRDSAKYNDWRLSIFNRDSFTCCSCGKIGGYLEAHHLISVKNLIKKYKPTSLNDILFIDAFWDISNGVTLCKTCHKKIHTKNKQVTGALK